MPLPSVTEKADLIRARNHTGFLGMFEDASFNQLITWIQSDRTGAINEIAQLTKELDAEMERARILSTALDHVLDQCLDKAPLYEIQGTAQAALRIARAPQTNKLNDILVGQMHTIIKLRDALKMALNILDCNSAWPEDDLDSRQELWNVWDTERTIG